ncbi:MAG: 4-hydroxy-tetrahydrodipicolinate reductase [Wenzhouxiangella sp.]|nr:MAG: 4-hydroxy-tetrahydrodipicolinate reductase [Wenzhouxiangella sp.]
MRVLISGGSGVIGRHLLACIESDPTLELAGTADSGRFFDPRAAGDVLIDFSHPALTVRSLDLACRLGIPAVIGTTGLDADCQVRLESAAERIPLCVAANFSLGVTVLLELVARAAAALDSSFEIEITETHHRRKLDAPSGTALALGEAAAAARGLVLEDCRVDERRARRSPRAVDDIGFQAVRGGDVAGEHTVHFLGTGERLELTHRASERRIFALGALLAARKLIGRRPGRVEFASLVLPTD